MPPRPPKQPCDVRLALRVLLREAALGVLLWGGAAADASARTAWFLLLLCAAVGWTRYRGMLRPKSWPMAVREGGLLYAGSLCVCTLLLVTAGAAPWWR